MTSVEPGRSVVLRSASLSVEIMTAGASIRSIHLAGVPYSLVLGAADPGFYGARNRPFLGASIGRNANRIANGRLAIGGRHHALSVNETPNQLHGGSGGFWSREWSIERAEGSSATLTLVSPDGEEGFPGQAAVSATFTVDDGGALRIDYGGTVDRRSLFNMTSHLYFNLSGEASARDHVLSVAADAYLPVDDALIPTGEVRPVEGTAFDFRAGRRISDGPAMLDHNFCLSTERTIVPRSVARLLSEASGIALEIETTECGLQIYDGAAFDGSILGLDGRGIGRYGGIALEPQFWPDAPNRPSFPQSFLNPGDSYLHTSTYRFRDNSGH